MSDSYIQQLFAERIGGVNYGKSTAIYKFEKIKRAKAAAKKAKPDVALIDLGVGEPDEMAFPMVVKALQTEAAKPENRGYADNGGADLQAGRRPLHEEPLRRHRRPRHRSPPLDRLQGRSLDPAGLPHQSRRLRAHDRPGLPGVRYARQVLRRPRP